MKKGLRVIYIPYHAKGNQDLWEYGVVKRVNEDGDVFVLYDNLETKMVTGDEPYTAKLTPVDCLRLE